MKERQQWQEVLDYAQRQMKHYGITQKEVAKQIGMQESQLSNILNCKLIPSTLRWIKIHNGILTIIALREIVSESLKTSQHENN